MDRRDPVQVGLIEHTISSQVNEYIIYHISKANGKTTIKFI